MVIRERIIKILEDVIGHGKPPAEVFVPENKDFGHYSTNLAMRLAKSRGENPVKFAGELAAKIAKVAPEGFFEKVEAAPPGFINFWLSKKTIQNEFRSVARDEKYGFGDSMRGKSVMVEYTDPNPFKLFHIGHLMSNAIGESFARLYEAAGAKVIRANYQGDVGIHVAKAVWAMKAHHGGPEDAVGKDIPLKEKSAYLGKMYALGSAAYGTSEEFKKKIEEFNKKIYDRSDEDIKELYEWGKKVSLEYFEEIYKRLGTKFDQYFFESEVGGEGVAMVRAHPNIFVESDGAVIFRGEPHGLHTRVFINSQGLPTYEAKELGLNKKKFELYPLDLSIIITGNEVIDYFKVLMKAMELMIPNVAAKTRHVPHGMLRLPSGKMSSRTGDVITAEALLKQVKLELRKRTSARSSPESEEREAAIEAMAVGAVKYSILKQNPGQDIVFDFDKSLSIQGDSGPYLQYAYARLQSILRKSEAGRQKSEISASTLEKEIELALMRKILEFPEVVVWASELLSSSILAGYLHELAATANRFYESTPVFGEENGPRREALLSLVGVSASVLKRGLNLLGIEAPERI